jgi:hypothetical protein
VLNTRDAGAYRSEAALQLIAEARAKGEISVIVTIDEDTSIDPDESSAAYRSQKSRLFAAQDRLVSRIHFGARRLNAADRFETVPLLVLTVTESELARLMRDPAVISLQPNRKLNARLRLEEMREITNIESVWGPNVGDKGDGSTIVIIDNGVDSDHPAVKGRVIEEGCISRVTSCIDPATQELKALRTASGKFAAWQCNVKPDFMHRRNAYCVSHGSEVTAAAAATAVVGKSFNGFGPKLDVVFIRLALDDARDAEFVKAYEMAFTLGKLHAAKIITSSIGLTDRRSANICDGVFPAFDTIVARIAASGMVVTNSAGNDKSDSRIDFPGCQSKVLAISASVEHSGKIAGFSDVSRMSDFLSPGNDMLTGPSIVAGAGTSYSTPSVAATIAVLRNAFRSRPVRDVVTALRCSGKYVNRPSTDTSIPLIDARAARELLEHARLAQGFEFDAANALNGWHQGSNAWRVAGGRALYESTLAQTNSAVYTDFCFDDFIAEARIKTTTTVNADLWHPTVFSELLFLTSTKGDPLETATRGIVGFKFGIQKTLGTTSTAITVNRLDPLYLIKKGVPAGTSSVLTLCLKLGVAVDPTVYNILRVERKGSRVRFFVNGVQHCEIDAGAERFRALGVYGASAPLAGVGNPTDIKSEVDFIHARSD